MIPDDNRMPRGAAIEEMLVAKMRADLTRRVEALLAFWAAAPDGATASCQR